MAGKSGQGTDQDTSKSPGTELREGSIAANGIFGVFARIFGRQKSGILTRQNQISLRDDALDREATLMNVLKSVTSNKSEPDLIEASKETKSSGFTFFGMRSKSKENVIDETDKGTEVKKLPTLDDKTIDKNKKFAPMENLTDAGNTKKSGLARFKRIRDEIFRKKHQTLKEEDAKEVTEIVEKTDEDKKEDGEQTDKKNDDENLNFDEQKEKNEEEGKKKDEDANGTQSSTESSTESSTSSSESDKSEGKKKVDRKTSRDDETETSTIKVERKPSQRSVHYEEDIKPQFKSGTPVRGSTFQR